LIGRPKCVAPQVPVQSTISPTLLPVLAAAALSLPRMQADAASLDPITKKLLASPGLELSPAESRACLVRCIAHGEAVASRAAGKRIVVVLGNTGAGKSAFINYLHGCKFQYEEEDKMVVRDDSELEELMRIGHTNRSETFSPQVEDATDSLGSGFAYADCPGFLDNRGFEINVANAANVRHTVCAASSAVVVVVVNYYSLRADRGKGLHDLLRILLSLFGSVEQVEAHAPSVLLAISQAPVTHPETGAAMSIERYLRTLLSPSGLDTATGEVLHALSGRVCVFHLLGRGDSSWLTRDALLERVRGLPPIGTPSSLFQSVLGSEDRERLRALIAALGKDLRECLSRCELRVRGQLGATSAAGFGEAARLAAELLELRVVEHGFVSSLVEGEVLAAARESVASQVAPVDALFLDGGLDGGDDAADGERLEEARGALRGVGELLTAFAGIDVVREPLQALVAQAEARLASAEERRAEARGRREMAAALQQTLRTVGSHALGEEYNVVREVLALPRAVAAAREGQARRQRALERAHAEQLGALGESGVAVRPREAEDRHAAERREEVLRSAAADAAWEAHIAAAADRLRRRDVDLLQREEGRAGGFWEKVGQGGQALRASAPPAFVDLSRKGLTPRDLDVVATLLRTLPPLADVRALALSGNGFADAGASALADAGAHGALAALERLFLDNVGLADGGLAELAAALAGGAMPRIHFVDLTRNGIGDGGVAALADAIRGGALPQLQTLYLYNNRVGSAGLAALVDALCASGCRLEKLYVDNNQVGEAGVAALVRAVEGGHLRSLRSLHLSGNPAPADLVQAAVQAVEGQAAGDAPRKRPAPQTRDIEAPPVD